MPFVYRKKSFRRGHSRVRDVLHNIQSWCILIAFICLLVKYTGGINYAWKYGNPKCGYANKIDNNRVYVTWPLHLVAESSLVVLWVKKKKFKISRTHIYLKTNNNISDRKRYRPYAVNSRLRQIRTDKTYVFFKRRKRFFSRLVSRRIYRNLSEQFTILKPYDDVFFFWIKHLT